MSVATAFPQDTMTQRERALILRDAKYLGLAPYFAPLFTISCDAHDTGCQVRIDMQTENLPRVTVWMGSAWYSSHYEFNDRGKPLGLSPEYVFVGPKLFAIFARIDNDLANQRAARAIKQANEAGAKAHEQNLTVAAYQRLFAAGERSNG